LTGIRSLLDSNSRVKMTEQKLVKYSPNIGHNRSILDLEASKVTSRKELRHSLRVLFVITVMVGC